ncbi:MAG TPA: proline racemase family protein [Bryobacteraceae bacterium]|jgi:4-hydroxyproline epimerase|nr:proline racemase family protein [Bryobacteraceae bacterium]
MASRFNAALRNGVIRIRAVDSHTAGEPTRVVVSGVPDLGDSSLADRRERLRTDFDPFRSAVVNEPRGSKAIVGALLTPPTDPSCAAGVIFFNNTGYLGMCGHGTIGVAATLAHLGRIGPGVHRLETPVGTVTITLNQDGSVVFENIPSFRLSANIQLNIPDFGPVIGDIAWGGNWFFLTRNRPCDLRPHNIEQLTAFTWAIRRALNSNSITGSQGAEIDHIYLYDDTPGPDSDSRNFVLCPGGSYDRSPCGTGTSALLACKYADGAIGPGSVWRQAGILGTVFEGTILTRDAKLYPTISGRAHITAEADLLIDARDPFAWGIKH